MKIDLVLRELHRAENDLAHELFQVADRHKVDHEIFHVARDLARWSQQHVAEIAEIAERYGVDLDPSRRARAGRWRRCWRRAASWSGRRRPRRCCC